MVGGVAVNFGHPPARCARVPLRFAKGGRWRGEGDPHPGPLPLRERGNGIQPDLSSRLSRSVLQLGALSLKLICEKIGVVSYRVFDSAE